MSHNSGAWEVQDQGAGGFSVWLGLLHMNPSWFVNGAFSLCPHMVEGGKGFLWGFFYKGTNVIHLGFCCHYLITSPRTHLLILSPWGWGFRHGNLVRTHIQTIAAASVGSMCLPVLEPRWKEQPFCGPCPSRGGDRGQRTQVEVCNPI